MREIKFRAWDKKRSRWLHEFQIMPNGAVRYRLPKEESPDQLEWQEISDIQLVQFTGLKDKNGKEIYEGDILKNTRHNNQLVEVYWEGCFTEKKSINGSHWIQWKGWYFRKLDDKETITYATYDNEIEVIGNIYENQELLK